MASLSPTDALAALRREAEEAAMHGPQCPRCAVLRKALALVAQVVEENTKVVAAKVFIPVPIAELQAENARLDAENRELRAKIMVYESDNGVSAYSAGKSFMRGQLEPALLAAQEENRRLRAENQELKWDGRYNELEAENRRLRLLIPSQTIADLRAENATLRAERDVWSGKACQEEQEAGNGPCGACRYCLPRINEKLRAENRELRDQIQHERAAYEDARNRVERALALKELPDMTLREELRTQLIVNLGQENAKLRAETARLVKAVDGIADHYSVCACDPKAYNSMCGRRQEIRLAVERAKESS